MTTAKNTKVSGMTKKTVVKKTKENLFVKTVIETPVVTTTTNGMKAFESTLNANVDLFSSIGSSRGKNLVPAFVKAYVEDKDTALRVLQWARDVRGGAGERDMFRSLLKHLAQNEPEALTNTRLLNNIPVIGRWDDLLVLFEVNNSKVHDKVVEIIKAGLEAGDGLCAKWMPRKGNVSVYLRQQFGWTPKRYRKTLVELTKVVETQMCEKKWDEINFSHVPSQAMSKYMTAFHRNASEKFIEFKNALKSGDKSVKVNATAVYPYDVIRSLKNSGHHEVANAMWDSLPDYMDNTNVLPMVDVSGSMCCSAGQIGGVTCLDVALSLGLYCSDKNKGAFKDMFLTFSGNPEMVTLHGTLHQKMTQMDSSMWEMNTDLNRAMDKILNIAVKGRVPKSDMPKILLILSDMQFDMCANMSAYDMMRTKYTAAGYDLPTIVFWNLNAKYGNQPVKFDKRGVVLVSGFSPAIIKPILSSNLNSISPQKLMMDAIGIDRYSI